MEMRKIESSFNLTMDISDLINYLNQTVLVLTEKEIGQVNNIIRTNKKEIDDYKRNINVLKEELDEMILILSRKKQLKVVLDLIGTLNREGVLIGQNKVKVRQLLDDIENKDFHTLGVIEQRLSLFRPGI